MAEEFLSACCPVPDTFIEELCDEEVWCVVAFLRREFDEIKADHFLLNLTSLIRLKSRFTEDFSIERDEFFDLGNFFGAGI